MPERPDHTTPETALDTIKSLIVAFVLAMTFRGFVTEGFVIPTGSMAPTLMGQHLLVHSRLTGYTFAAGLDGSGQRPDERRLADPMLGPQYRSAGVSRGPLRPRAGDRILVIKALYPFCPPRRFDVVVFKNPTEPTGDMSNYIKRLVGLPNEQIWLVDGDVFAAPLAPEQLVFANGVLDREQSTPAALDSFHICRKPEHVQRAVWQPVYDSDYVPIDPDRTADVVGSRALDPPWEGSLWQVQERLGAGGAAPARPARAYRCQSAEPSDLRWRDEVRELDDWTAYNMLVPAPPPAPVSDLRVSASIVADQAGLSTTLEIQARSHVFQFALEGGQAVVRLWPAGNPQARVQQAAPLALPAPGRVFNVEFWHVDQAMTIYIDGRRIVNLEYDWLSGDRLKNATGEVYPERIADLVGRTPQPAKLRWLFHGSPVTLQRVRVDRDIYYRYDELRRYRGENPPYLNGPGFGTHPEQNPALLGPDHFMMLGDNSQSSQDSRLWGSPAPIVQAQIGDGSPFVVHRSLLLGKAWVVYFPALYSLRDGGTPFIPDFGRLRFIR